MSTIYVARDIIVDTLTLVKNISTNGNVVLLGNGTGVSDSSRIINGEADPDGYLIRLTGKDVSLTIGGDYSTESSSGRRYNLYITTEPPEPRELEKDIAATAVTASGDLSLYMIAQTGAYGTGRSYTRTLKDNQDANIKIYVKSGNATAFGVTGALKVWSDLVGAITVAGISSATGIRAASLTLGNNMKANIGVTAQIYGYATLPAPRNEEEFMARFATPDPQRATAYGIKADGDLVAEYGVWQGGVVSATVKGSTYVGSGAELNDIDLAAFAVSAGGSVFFNRMQSGTISAGFGANTFNLTSAVWPLVSGAVVIPVPDQVSGDRFTAAALTGSAVRVNTAESGLTVAANIAGNAMNWSDAVESGAAVAIGFNSNVFSAAGVSAGSELALGDFGAKVSGGALNNKFGATYSGGGVFQLSAPGNITLNASMQASGNVFAAAGVSAGEIVSGASLAGSITARTVGNTLGETVIDFTEVGISGGTASVIVASSLLTRNTTVNVSGNTFDAVGVRASAINSGAETAYAAITSAAAAATVLVSAADIYGNVLLGSAPTTMADRIKSAVVASGASVFAPVSGGIDVTGSIGATLSGNRIGVEAIDSGAAVISKLVNLNVQMDDNAYGAVGIDAGDALTLGNYGGAVNAVASSNALAWTDGHTSGGLLVYSTTVAGSGNTFEAVGIGARSLIVESRFTGSVNVNATGNNGIFDFNVKGIDVKNALFRDNLGGSVSVAFKNTDLKNNADALIAGGTAAIAGIATGDKKSDNPVLMVLGRINTGITLSVTGNKNFSARPDVSGIQAGMLVADAFSGTITITSSTPGRSLSEASQLMLDVVQDFGLGVGEFRTLGGDAFDINGSITANAVGAVSTNALNLRVSGDITANGVKVTVSGMTIEALPGYAILGDGKSALSGSYTTSNADAVELAATAKITGIIDLSAGVNTITIDSNATVSGSLRATGGLMNIRFDLNGAAKSAAVVTADAEDISLYSTSNITVNLNNAATTGSTAYKLFSYSGSASNGVWTDDRREISFVYLGKTIKETLTVSGSTSYVDFDFNEFGYDVKGKLEYKNKAVTVTVTNNETLDDFGGELSTIFDNASHQAVLSWTDDTSYGANNDEAYEIEYSVNGGKTVTTFTTLKSAVIFGVDEGDSFTWKVRRSKGSGAIVSQWSDGYADTVDMLSTTVAADGASATLAWGNDLSAYDRIVVAYSINGGTEDVETLTDSSATSLVVDVSDVSTLKWRVRGESDAAAGSWVVSDGNIVRLSGEPQPIDIGGLFAENPDAADGVDASRVRLSWDRASSEKEIANYVVEYFETKDPRTADEVAAIFADPASAQGTEVFARTTTATQILLTSLSNGGYVYWRLKAVDVSGASSEFVNAEEFRMSAGDDAPPYWRPLREGETEVFPTFVTFDCRHDAAEGYTATVKADFKWVNALDTGAGVKYYDFQYKLSSADWGADEVIAEDGSDSYTRTVENIASGNYDFRVRAVDWAGNKSDYVVKSNVFIGDDRKPVWSAAAEVNDVVTIVDGTLPRTKSITVEFSWDPAGDEFPADDPLHRTGSKVRKYQLEYKLTGTDWSGAEVITVDYDDASHFDGSKYHVTVNNVANGSYDYRVQAIDFFDNAGEYLVQNGVWLGDNDDPYWRDLRPGESTTSVSDVKVDRRDEANPTVSAKIRWVNAKDDKSGVRNYLLQYKLSTDSWDDTDKVVSVSFWEDGSDSYSTTVSGLAEGVYDYRVKALDYFDNEVVVDGQQFGGADITPPQGTFGKITSTVTAEWTNLKTDYRDENGNPEYYDMLTSATVTLDWSEATFTDAGSVIYTVSVADNPTFSGPRAFSFDTTGKTFTLDDSIGTASVLLADLRQAYFQISVRDDQGNVNMYPSDLQTVTLRADGKDVNISSDMSGPTGLAYSASKTSDGKSRVTFRWSSSDANLFGVRDYTLSTLVNGVRSDYTKIGTTSYTVGNLADGDYTWTVWANSGIGTAAAADRKVFRLDATAPVFGAGAASSVDVANRDFVINWSAATDANGIAGYVLYYGTGTPDETWISKQVDTTSFQGNVNLSAGSPYTVNYLIEAIDNFGNRSSDVNSYLRGTFTIGAKTGDITVTDLDSEPQFVNSGVGPNETTKKLKFHVDKDNTDIYTTIVIGDRNSGYRSGSGVTVRVFSAADPGKAFSATVVGYGTNVAQLRVAQAGDYYLQVSTNRLSAVTKFSAAVAADTPTGIKLSQEDNAWDGMDRAAGKRISDKTYHGQYRLAIGHDAAGNVPQRVLLSDYVGGGDATDYRRFDIETAGKYEFTLDGVASQLVFTIYSVGFDRSGNVNSVRPIRNLILAPRYDYRTQTWSASVNTGSVLIDKGTYYFSVTAPGAARNMNSAYDVSVSGTAFVKGKNFDDWTNVAAVGNGPGAELDRLGTISAPGAVISNEWVGFGDAVDYKEFSIDTAAKLSFTVNSTDTVMFSICRLDSMPSRTGGTTYIVRPLQAAAVIARNGRASATTNGLLLEAGTYYIKVESPYARLGGSADYNVALNNSSVFYTKGKNFDDWTNVAAVGNGPGAELDRLGTISAPGPVISNEWVGFGDAVDYKEFSIDTAAKLSFTVNSTDMVRFSICRLDTLPGRGGATTYIVRPLQMAAVNGTATTNGLLLDAGTYYIKVESPYARVGGSADYKVALDKSSVFYSGSSHFGNETWDTATLLDGDVDGFLAYAAGFDRVDYFDLSSVDDLKLDMAQGKTRVSFFDADRRAVKVAEITMADGSKMTNVSSLTLSADDATTDFLTASLDDAVKYLKIEAATTGANDYRLSLIA